ncbi:MAG: glycosyltransferase family 4 protein [Chitinophagaceae bacterium]
MKILFDPQIFYFQNFGGISRYFYELIKNIDSDIECKLPLILSNNEYLSRKDISLHHHFFLIKNFRGKQQILKTINKTYFKFYPKSKIDIVHPTYYDPYFLRSIGNKPFVLTVYDMIHEKYKHIFNEQDTTTNFKQLLCQKATKIIVISEKTKADLMDIFGINENKIEVIYLGQSFQPNLEDSLSLPEKYILFTGQRGGYKNFNRFIRAFSMLHKIDKNVKLVCTGSKFSNEEKEKISNLEISNAVLHFFASDRQLAELYRRALLFVFPSEYEGFGIPILESFAAGCPIALSKASCFPEIATDAGFYFDPLNIESIFETLKNAIDSDLDRKNLITKGYERLKFFSWEKMAKYTSTLYKSLL